MENLRSPPIMGKKIYKLLEQYKILLLQDKAFPSIVAEIVGKTIRGSWWGHPLANPIYNGLLWLEHNRPVLAVKLVDGKITYMHKSLFDDLYSIVCEPRDWQLETLKEEERRLFDFVCRAKEVVSDDPRIKKVAKDPKKAFQALEKRLLIYSTEEHTPSGKHIKEYMRWDRSKIAMARPKDYLESKSRIEKIFFKLCEKSNSTAKLPW